MTMTITETLHIACDNKPIDHSARRGKKKTLEMFFKSIARTMFARQTQQNNASFHQVQVLYLSAGDYQDCRLLMASETLYV